MNILTTVLPVQRVQQEMDTGSTGWIAGPEVVWELSANERGARISRVDSRARAGCDRAYIGN